MGFLYILSWISLALQITFVTLSLVAGLYYLAELVEEYTSAARRCILFMISSTIFVYIMLAIFDDLPWRIVIFGLAAQAFHFSIMSSFPFIKFVSLPFLGSITFLLINHFLAFQHFTSFYYPFVQILAYFTVCLWMVPFALFVSLSANDNVLPTVNEERIHMGSPDVVSNYFSRHKKQDLRSLFNYMKESVLPRRSKKAF